MILEGKNKGRLQRQTDPTEVLSIKGKPFLGFPLCGDRCLYIIKIHQNPPRKSYQALEMKVSVQYYL